MADPASITLSNGAVVRVGDVVSMIGRKIAIVQFAGAGQFYGCDGPDRAILRFLSDIDLAALAQPASAPTGVAELVAEVRAAAEQFHFYKNQHRQKGTPDGDEKSITNEHWARRMERVADALAALGGEDG